MASKAKLKRREQEFAVEVQAWDNDIDPDNAEDWYSMTVGWALAKGDKPSDAHHVARHIRYKSGLG